MSNGGRASRQKDNRLERALIRALQNADFAALLATQIAKAAEKNSRTRVIGAPDAVPPAKGT